jgi:hypothetical protein
LENKYEEAYSVKKLLILMMISITCLFSACAKNENQTSDNPSASREAGDSSNAADKTIAVTEESANPPQNTSEPASSPSATPSETAESIRNTDEQTSTSSSQEPETSTEEPTDSGPIPEGNLVVLDDPYAEPLLPPPETKEVLRLPNEVFFYPALADDDAIHLRELDTGSGLLEPCGFAALDETRFIILDNIGRYIKLYQDGKCVRKYFMEPDDEPWYIEIDEEYFYFVNGIEDLDTADDNMLYQVDLETGERKAIPYYDPDPNHVCFDSMLWIDGQLIIIDWLSLKPDTSNCNSCLNLSGDKVIPTDKGFQRDGTNSVVSSGTTTWIFGKDGFSFKYVFPIYVDMQDNLYAEIWDSHLIGKEGESTLRKYSPQGDLLWCLNVSDPDMIRHCPHAVKYCRDGKIYFMIIWEKETVIYQVQEEID